MPHGIGWKILVCLGITFFAQLPMQALEDGAQLLPKIADQPVSYVLESYFQVANRLDNGNYKEMVSHNQVKESADFFEIQVTNDLGQVFYRFDKQGNLLDYESSVPQQGTNETKADKPKWVALHRLRPDFYQQSQRKADGTIEKADIQLNRQDILIAQLPYTLQKALKANLTAGVNLVGVIDASMRLNFDIRFISTKDPMALAKQFQYPDSISKAFKGQTIAIVAEVAPAGLISILYPHKIYFAYGPGPDYLLLAFWGGDPAKAFFQVRSK